jgi:hypothetical protein
MVELRDEEDGRVALIMDDEELPFALEALMRAGYVLAPPSAADAARAAEEPDELAEEELEDESLAELEDEPDEDRQDEPEVVTRSAPARSRNARSR